jgi:hypothetical protein
MFTGRCRYGDENSLAGFMAILQAMISYVQDSGDTLHSVRAGDYLVVFLVRGSLYLVAAAATGEPAAVLAQQLHVFYQQLIAILTNAVERAFIKSPKFDMRQLLGGTVPVLQALIKSFTWNPALLLGAIPPLPLPPTARKAAFSALQAVHVPHLQFAVLLSGSQVVAVLSPRGAPMHHQDLLLVSNFVHSSESFRLSESFSPVCLPHYNPAAFLYTYITYVQGGACLLLLSSAPDSFHELAAARVTIENNLKKQNVIGAIQRMTAEPLLQLSKIPAGAGGGTLGQTPLWHFLFHYTTLGQVVSSQFRTPLDTKKTQKRLLREYQRVFAITHANPSMTAQHRVHFRAGENHVLLAVMGQDFELYATFDPLTDKASAVPICNRLCVWLNQKEADLFMAPFPQYFEFT